MVTATSQTGGGGSVQGRHVLVTGGAGYLGSVLVPLLLQQGYEVSVVDLFLFGEAPLLPMASNPRLHVYHADIVRLHELGELCRDVDAVVHLASISNDPSCDIDPNLSIRTNFLATAALAQRARAEGVQQFIFASSCSVYGAASGRPLDELSHTGPVTLYALTKLMSEHEVLQLSSHDFRVSVLRFSTLFGLSPRMRFDLAINYMTKRTIEGVPIMVNGSGQQYRPFVHIRDAANAILSVLRADPAVVRGQTFNVGGDHLNYTLQALAEEIQRAVPDAEVQRASMGDDVRSYRVRFEKVRQALGFVPAYSVADAVEEITEAAGSGRLTNLDDERYYNIALMKRIYDKGAESPWVAVSSPVPTPAASAPARAVRTHKRVAARAVSAPAAALLADRRVAVP
jgi:nucleoside-diphosphate-sugar epimerase